MDTPRRPDDVGAPILPEPTREAARSHESAFWRRAARWGTADRPDWWLRYGPVPFGWAAAALVPSARRAVLRNLRRVRGEASFGRDVRDVLSTFGSYAGCIAEVLANDGASAPARPHATIYGDRFFAQALRGAPPEAPRPERRRGVVIVTAHTAGWESVGPLLGKDHERELTFVMHREADAEAGKVQDDARRRTGIAIAHVGDPLASLPLLRKLQDGGIVALQLDRIVPGMRTRSVELLGGCGEVPEGPLRLAQVSGAPILPVFCARRGFREYVVEAFEPRWIDRRADAAELDAVAAHVADAMTRFLRAHPTQWFQFGGS